MTPVNDQYVLIRWGDTLSQIAVDLGIPMRKLQFLNNIENPDIIYAGKFLRIA